MGLYDYVNFDCPSCGHKVQFQSKALEECGMTEFPTTAVPAAIAYDIWEQTEACVCGKYWAPMFKHIPQETFNMVLEEMSEL